MSHLSTLCKLYEEPKQRRSYGLINPAKFTTIKIIEQRILSNKLIERTLFSKEYTFEILFLHVNYVTLSSFLFETALMQDYIDKIVKLLFALSSTNTHKLKTMHKSSTMI